MMLRRVNTRALQISRSHRARMAAIDTSVEEWEDDNLHESTGSNSSKAEAGYCTAGDESIRRWGEGTDQATHLEDDDAAHENPFDGEELVYPAVCQLAGTGGQQAALGVSQRGRRLGKTQTDTHYAAPYQPTSPSELKLSVICGVAVATMLASCVEIDAKTLAVFEYSRSTSQKTIESRNGHCLQVRQGEPRVPKPER